MNLWTQFKKWLLKPSPLFLGVDGNWHCQYCRAYGYHYLDVLMVDGVAVKQPPPVEPKNFQHELYCSKGS